MTFLQPWLVAQPTDTLFGLDGGDAAVTFFTDLLSPVTIKQTGSTVVGFCSVFVRCVVLRGCCRCCCCCRCCSNRPEYRRSLINGTFALCICVLVWSVLLLPLLLHPQEDTAFGVFADMLRACRPAGM